MSNTTLTSSTAGRTNASYGERALMPTAKLRAAGGVCPPHAVAVSGDVASSAWKIADVVVTDERGFTRIRAWSPPGC